jgi:CDP-glucose 4,6-dehydratase
VRYFITGHTGFKGSWLTLWLTSQGHEVYGLSLDPEPGSLFELAEVSEVCARDQRRDIRDPETVKAAVSWAEPEVVVHLAAQPLVLDSYRRPRWTFETNVMGTLNVLEAVGLQQNVKGLLVVTTDKVYRNLNQRKGFLETDPLGGNDPYSASKAMADTLTHSWATSFPGTRTAVARAGNVIGGGDISPDRLLPDIVKNLRSGTNPVLRNPEAVRPWQHVLDCLNGYQTLIDRLVTENEDFDFDGGWNFGPDLDSFVSVGEVTTAAIRNWGESGAWIADSNENLHEAKLLALDSTRAKTFLEWNNLLGVEDALLWTLEWYQAVDAGVPARDLTLQQVDIFEKLVTRA